MNRMEEVVSSQSRSEPRVEKLSISGQALEFPSGVGPVGIHGDAIVFVASRCLMVLDCATGSLRRIASLAEAAWYEPGQFACGGVWMSGESFSRFFDVFGKGIEFDDEAPGVGAGAFFGNRVVFFDRPSKSFLLKELGVDETLAIDEPADSLTRWAADEGRIFMHRHGRCVKCFNWQGDEIWAQPTELWHFKFLDRVPQLYEDKIIVHLGVVRATRVDYQVAAFDKIDGHEIWRARLPDAPQTVFHANDRVYLAMDWQIVVLDAATGATVIDAPSGLQLNADIKTLGAREGLTRTGLYATRKNLFFVSLYHRIIRVFTANGEELKQELQMPDPLSPIPHSSWRPIFDRAVADDDRIVFALWLEHGIQALLLLRSTDDYDAITIAPRPQSEITETDKDERGCHGFRISVSDVEFDRLVRYGEIFLRELILTRAADATEHDHYDPLFNGNARARSGVL